MNYQLFALIGLLLVTSCKYEPDSHSPDDDSAGTQTNEAHKRHEAIATEILSIGYAFGNEVLQLNDANAVNFVTAVKSLADNLEKISNELDTLGPFPSSLRESTLKKLAENGKNIAQASQSKTTSGSLHPDAAKLTAAAADEYFSAWTSVMMKAGLAIEAKRETSGVDTNNQKTN